MFGTFGKSVIGVNHLTGPVSDEEEKQARFARHEVVRGKPVIQDLGNDAGTRFLSFFFDETFADVEAEISKIETAFNFRIPMTLFVNLIQLEVSVFVIERLTIRRQKTDTQGRTVRAELEAELLESTLNVRGGLMPGLASVAALNPLLKRS